MRNSKNSLIKWFIGAVTLLAGVQSAFAVCGGTLHVKAPSTWKDIYIAAENKVVKAAANTGDWVVIDLKETAPSQGWGSNFFRITDGGSNACGSNTGLIINQNSFDIGGDICNISDQVFDLACPGVGVDMYVSADPLDETKTYIGDAPSDAKYFHVLVPNYEEWQSDQIVINIDGKKDTVMSPDPLLCGWVTMVFSEPPENVYLYRKNNPEAKLGLGGLTAFENGESAEVIPLAGIFSSQSTNELYFMPDEDDWLDEGDLGWYVTDPGVPEEGDNSRCSFILAAMIYDSDESVNNLFSHDGGGDFSNPYGKITGFSNGCVGVHHNIVDVNLGPDGKPKFSGSKNAVKCFGDETNFKTLFNYTPGKNEVQCYDMRFRHYGKDTRWGFDSDSAETNGLVGGFSPLEESNDDGVVTMNGVRMGPLAAARTKRFAAGPVPVLDTVFPMGKIADFDHYCNTPGWTGGVDCETKFDNGDNPADFWCWGSYCKAGFQRWGCAEANEDDGKCNKAGDLPLTQNEKRNQQFCFQSHAQFTYQEDQEFTFRGDDDIWVFINNKLAVDNGGAHLAAPGHVVLKNLNTTYGDGFLKPGYQYPIDIFFCDRRTTMSNVIIKTNMYIVQKQAIKFEKTRDPSDKTVENYAVWYTETGDGGCASQLRGDDEGLECRGQDFLTKPECQEVLKTFEYYLIPGSDLSYDGPEKKPLETGKVWMGGIDLSNPAIPVIHKKKLALDPGRWTLYVSINGNKKKIASFRPAGEVDVVAGDAIAQYFDDAENEIVSRRTLYDFTSRAMAGPSEPAFSDLIPVYVTAVSGSDPTLNRIIMLPDDAKGVNYKLEFDAGMRAFKKVGDNLTEIYSKTTALKVDGIDTIYVYVPQSFMEVSKKTYSIKVEGKSSGANITFGLPQLGFVDTLYKELDVTTGDSVWKYGKIVDGDVADASGKYEERLTGMDYNFFLVAFDAFEEKVCTTCNFALSVSGETSDKVDVKDRDLLIVENGGLILQAHSMKKYPFGGAEGPAQLVLEGENPAMAGVYNPIYFVDPPCPIPLFVDVFDVEGAVPAVPFKNIPAQYQSPDGAYQDGIADMIDIYYDRKIPADSLPLAICMTWDTSSAQKIEPFKEGVVANDEKKTIYCNAWVKREDTSPKMEVTNCDQTMNDLEGKLIVDDAGNAVKYCDRRIRIQGLALSKKPKTTGPGMLHSFSEFVDAKGRPTKQGFTPTQGETAIIDRIAPIPLSARVITVKDAKKQPTNTDRMTITMSEPVQFKKGVSEDKMLDPFQFFLASNLTIDESERFRGVRSYAPGVSRDSIIVSYTTKDEKTNQQFITPQRGDYLRMGGNIADEASVIWTDAVDINIIPNSKEIRDSLKEGNAGDKFLDETYFWNCPTGLEDSKRSISPWVEITGSSRYDIHTNTFAYTGNAVETWNETQAPMFIKPYEKYLDSAAIFAENGYIPGFFIEADMLSAVQDYAAENKGKLPNIDKVFMSYDVNIYTNLGNHVANLSGRVYCSDAKNKKTFGESGVFGGGDCTEATSSRNWFIGWNMRSEDGREVATGAYIVKVEIVLKAEGKRTPLRYDPKIIGVKRTDAVYVPPKKD